MSGIQVSGFMFVRNVVRLDYPVVESISSILPIVDEFIVNVGPSDDGTLDLLRSIGNAKIKIVESQWNPNMTTGGYLYAQQTNIALFNCKGKWAFHLQADEVVHQEDLPLIRRYLDRYRDDDRVEGLALRELNFWGDYRTLVNVYPWRGRRRCWVVKPHRFVLSRGDAAGFTVHPKYKERGRRIRVMDTGARIFHYSNLKSGVGLEDKSRAVSQYWKEDNTRGGAPPGLYEHFPRRFLLRYEGSHPQAMAERIRRHPVTMDWSSSRWRMKMTWSDRWRLAKTLWVEYLTDRFTGRGSYKLLQEKE
jgi:glycosyltransferase involved in cell wall biosynthesis